MTAATRMRIVDLLVVTVPIKTTNPNNGQTGNSRLAAIIRTNQRKKQRGEVRLHMLKALGGGVPTMPLTITVTRIAPSNGLDPHDGLGAALKGVIDGVADALGLKNDRDERVTWKLEQRRGKSYAVEIKVESRVG